MRAHWSCQSKHLTAHYHRAALIRLHDCTAVFGHFLASLRLTDQLSEVATAGLTRVRCVVHKNTISCEAPLLPAQLWKQRGK